MSAALWVKNKQNKSCIAIFLNNNENKFDTGA